MNYKMSKPSFMKNVTLRISLTIPLRFRGVIVLPFLTRLYPQDIYGVWIQVLLISELLRNLLSLQLGTALVRYLSGEDNPKQKIKAVFTITLCCSLGFILLMFIFGEETSRLIFGSIHLQLILIVASFWILIRALIRVGLSVLRSQERIGILSMTELLSALLLVFSVFIAYLMRLDLHWLIVICSVGDGILLIWILFKISIGFPFVALHKSAWEVKKLISFSMPLAFGSIFLWLTRSIDRFLIVQLLGLASVGVYGVSLQIASLLFIVLRPINFVLFPRTAAVWNQKNQNGVNRYFSQAISLTFILGAPAIVGIFMTSDGLIKLLAGGNYLSSKGIIFCLLLSGFAYMMYQNHLFVIHLVERTYLLPILFVCTATLNCVSGYIFISNLGLQGAALSRALTLSIMAIVVTIWARRYVRFRVNWSLVFRVGLASLIMGLALNWFPMDSWGNLIIKIIGGSAIFLGALFLLRVISKENLVMLKNQF